MQLGFFKSLIPIEARLFTWEIATNFDEILSERELDEVFVKEFPSTCARLKDCSPPGRFVIWPLLSFNASEGRLSRYLVAVVKSEPGAMSARMLPRQIWRYALADSTILKWAENNRLDDNSGNYVCYGMEGNEFYLMVFFEGRFCHWLEETVCDAAGDDTPCDWFENRLDRFRRFLKNDPLFSRAASFTEICLEGAFDERLFRGASGDPFWRSLDLRKDRCLLKTQKGTVRLRNAAYGGFCLMLLAIVSLVFYGRYTGQYDECVGCVEALPVELNPPPELFEVAETDEVYEQMVSSAASGMSCVLPEFRVHGLVSGKVAMLSLVESEGATKSLVLGEGDTLGNFKVLSIGRDAIRLACGGKIVEGGVGESVLR